MRHLAVVLAVLLLSACGTRPYKPIEYPLRDGLIAAFPVNGTVAVTNAQPSTTETIVYSYGGTRLASSLKDITDLLTQQTQKELQKAGQPVKPGKAKSIGLKVDVLLSEYLFFSWKSHIEFQAKLGDGQTLNFNVRHASGILIQDLNGCIAEGVMNLLNDPRVNTYLSSAT